MSRWVIPQKQGLRASNGEASDDIVKRVAKYVPAEILTGYTALFAILAALNVDANHKRWVAVLLIAIFVMVTFIYIRKNAPAGSVRQAHTIVSPIAFVALAYPIASSALLDWYMPILTFLGQVVVIALSYFIQPVES